MELVQIVQCSLSLCLSGTVPLEQSDELHPDDLLLELGRVHPKTCEWGCYSIGMQLQGEKLFCYCLVGDEVTRGADTGALRELRDSTEYRR